MAMQTIQIMKRPILGITVEQRTGDEYFLLASVERVGVLWRMQHELPNFNIHSFLSQSGTVEFIRAAEAKAGKPVIIRGTKGRNSKTWIHPYLMLKLLMSMAPALEVEAIAWMYDELLKFRDDSGDSFKKMSGSLYHNFSNKQMFAHFIADTANQVREACGVVGKDWNQATEEQLRLRDKIHETVSIAADWFPDPRQAVRLGIVRASKDV